MSGDRRPLVSFVVLCYNTERYVGECIRSILNLETDVPYEIVAMDDHSTDRTYEVLRSFSDSRLRVFRNEENLGHALAIERAFHETRGGYVARIDSDDRYRPGFLTRTVPILNTYPEVGMVYGDASMIGPAGQEYAPTCDRRHGGRDFKGCELIDLLEWNFVCAPTIIARRDCFLRQLPVPRHLAFHDWYFTVKIARESEFYYLSAVIADYRVHPGNMHTRTILDKTEEKSIFWFLEQIYGTSEPHRELEEQKLRARRRIYSRHYVTLADKYFGASMNADARRCYWQAIRYRPSSLLSTGLSRRFGATLVGREIYERVKAFCKRETARSAAPPAKAA